MATAQASNSLESSAEKAVTDSRTEESILLIEDSEEAMWLVRDALGQYGKGKYHLEWAQDLKEGLLYLSKKNAALVLLDLGLPDSSGPSSFDAIHKVVPDLPVLVLTADDRPETEAAVIASGTQDYLVKDQISGPMLVQAISAALYQARSTNK